MSGSLKLEVHVSPEKLPEPCTVERGPTVRSPRIHDIWHCPPCKQTSLGKSLHWRKKSHYVAFFCIQHITDSHAERKNSGVANHIQNDNKPKLEKFITLIVMKANICCMLNTHQAPCWTLCISNEVLKSVLVVSVLFCSTGDTGRLFDFSAVTFPIIFFGILSYPRW